MKNFTGPAPLQPDELRRALGKQMRHPYITNQGILASAASRAQGDEVSNFQGKEKIEKELLTPVNSE